MALPDRFVTDFSGVQRNFEKLSSLVATLNSSLTANTASITSLQTSVTALQASVASLTTTVSTKVGSVTASSGLTYTGTTSVAITIDPALTSSNAVPSTSNRMQLSGYRSITAGAAGTSSGSPLLASDYFVEVASTASTVGNVYLPSATATGQFAGKIYIIRNGRTANISVQGVATTASGSFIAIQKGTVLTVINTGTKWRSLGGMTGIVTIGGVT
jgi:hypothetical protein